MATYYYSSGAGEMRLQGAISNAAGAITLDTVVGLPASMPFKVVIDPGIATEEILKVTNVAGSTLTVTRGWDGSLANAHSNGAVVRHMVTAEDIRLSREHEEAVDVHGVTGIVGMADTQVLTNKTFQATTTETPLKIQQSGVSTSDLVQVLTAGGSLRAKVTTLGLYLRTATANVAEFLTGDGETVGGFIARLSPSLTGSDGLRVAMPAASTGKALAVALNGVEKAKIEADGDVTAQNITATGLASTGPVSGTTGTFSGAVAGTTGTFSGGVSGTTGTYSGAVSGTTGTFSGAVTAASLSLSGNSTITGDITVDDITGDVGTFTNLSSTNPISAPGLRTSGEGAMLGTAPPAGTPFLIRPFFGVTTSNGAGGWGMGFTGGAFPNGMITCLAMSGDGQGDVVLLQGNMTLGAANGIIYKADGTPAANVLVRINGIAVGW